MRTIVVGTGPAAFGAVLGLLDAANNASNEIIVVGQREESDGLEIARRDPRTWSVRETKSLQRALKKSARGFLPPRSHLGNAMASWADAGAAALLRSTEFGGLGNFWSCGMYQFQDRDIEDWSLRFSDLDPYYRRIAQIVGVAGRSDDLEKIYRDGHLFNRPAQRLSPIVQRLVDAVGSEGRKTPNHTVFAGVNRIAVETRDKKETSCVRCGGCMYGCFRGALFVAGPELKRLIERNGLEFHAGRVISVTPSDTRPSVKFQNGDVIDADRIILCAGAIGSTEILLRSLDQPGRTAFIDDNENFLFPVFSSPVSKPGDDRHFAFGEATLWFQPEFNQGRPAQASVAPTFDLLFDYNVPSPLVSFAHRAASWMRRRALLVRLHIDGATATRYLVGISSSGAVKIRRVRSGASNFRARAAISSLRQALRGTGFVLPPFPLTRASTSAHYCGGFARAMERTGDPATGPVMPGIYLADSAAFPRLPVQAPTFTILAYAMRTAHMATGTLVAA